MSLRMPTDGSAENLRQWQLAKLWETVSHAARASRFYGAKLQESGVRAEDLKSLDDLERLPFTCSGDLIGRGSDFLCVPNDDVERIVTLRTSGTTSPKRVFFTREDLRETVDFFERGMIAVPGTRILICFPGGAPASVGSLLKEALSRGGREAFVHGFVDGSGGVENTLKALERLRVDSLVGLPVQMRALAMSGRMKNIVGMLVTGDYASPSLVQSIEKKLGCVVLRHYGMTETGYGAAVECLVRRGCHIRKELLFEVVDPSGNRLPDGSWGELAVTTLTRRAMPLLRYRTGDEGRILADNCGCGSVLPRIEIGGRLNNTAVFTMDRPQSFLGHALPLTLKPAKGICPFGIPVINDCEKRYMLRVEADGAMTESRLKLAELDEALFGLEWIVDFCCFTDKENSRFSLEVKTADPPCNWQEQLKERLAGFSAVGAFEIRLWKELESSEESWNKRTLKANTAY